MSHTVKYSTDAFEYQQLRTLVALRLPFNAWQHVEFRRLIHLAQSAPTHERLDLMNSARIRNCLTEQVDIGRRAMLDSIPKGVKVSIATDCWTSPNRLSFMAVTGLVTFRQADDLTRIVILLTRIGATAKSYSGLNTLRVNI